MILPSGYFLKEDSMLLARLVLLALISISELFSADLEAPIRQDYRGWASRQAHNKRDVLSYVENLKGQGKHDWAANILANGTGFGGLRSTTASSDEQKRMFAILKGLNPTERFIERAKARNEVEKSHQDFIDILILAEKLKNTPYLVVGRSTDYKYVISRDNAISMVRAFWGTENDINNIKASMRIELLFDDSPLRKVLAGTPGVMSYTTDTPIISRASSDYLGGTATPHLHSYNGDIPAPHVVIRLDRDATKTKTNYIVIEHPKPHEGQSILYRPHFWVHKNENFAGSTVSHVNVSIQGPTSYNFNIDGYNPLNGGEVHTHDNRLSPNNMRINGFVFGGDHSIAFSTHAELNDGRVNNTLHIALGGDEPITTKSWVDQRAYAALEATLARLDLPSQQFFGRYLGYIN
jgi:hypothetical protein